MIAGFPSHVSRAHRAAFSLVEVVVAVGLFAVGIVAVLGLFAPLAQSIRSNADAEAAAGTADVLRSRLRAESLATVAGYLKTPEVFRQQSSDPGYDPSTDEQVFYTNLAGDKIGRSRDAIWDGHDAEKYFELTLIRNEALSPAANDAIAGWLAFHVRVRWPANLARAGFPGGAAAAQGQKQIFFFTGSVRR